MTSNKPPSMSDSVMKVLQDKHVKMRSRYRILAEKLGIQSLVILTILLVMFFLSLTVYLVQSSGGLFYLSLGSPGIWAFLEMFPIEFVLIALLLFGMLGYLWKHFAILYRYRFDHILLGLIGLVLLGSSIFTISGLHEIIEREAVAGRVPFARPLFDRMGGERLRNGVDGVLVEILEDSFKINAGKKTVTIQFDEFTRFPIGKNLTIGDHIHAGGEWIAEDVFLAHGIVPSRDLPQRDMMRTPMRAPGPPMMQQLPPDYQEPL